MKRTKRIASDLLKAMEAELLRWPGVTYSFDNGTNHAHIELEFDGRTVRSPVPRDLGDHRVLNNRIAQLRAELRGLGALRAEDRFFDAPPEPRRKRQRIKREAPLPHISDPRPDGWAPLRALWRRMFGEAA